MLKVLKQPYKIVAEMPPNAVCPFCFRKGCLLVVHSGAEMDDQTTNELRCAKCGTSFSRRDTWKKFIKL